MRKSVFDTHVCAQQRLGSTCASTVRSVFTHCLMGSQGSRVELGGGGGRVFKHDLNNIERDVKHQTILISSSGPHQ